MTATDPHAVLRATAELAVDAMWRNDPVAAYEAVQLARNPRHEVWGSAKNSLRSRGLVDATGRMHDLVREVVLAAFTGEGYDLTYVGRSKP